MSDTWHDPTHPQPPTGAIRTLLRFGIFIGLGTVVAFAAVTLLSAALFLFAVWESRPPSQIDFDAARWRESPGEEVRWRMQEDLLKSGVLTAMTGAEIVDLLGPDCGCMHFRESDLVYNMGPEQGLFSIDNVWLTIEFNPDGTFRRARVVSD